MTGLQTSATPNRNRTAVLTPYPIPRALRSRKVVNLGDGFILQAIERLLGPFKAERILSPRVAPTSAEFATLKEAPAVILAGANQLNNHYTVWPGLTAERIRTERLRLIPFGIGLHGEENYADALSDPTREVLVALHEQIEFSSWRCPNTVALLRRELPRLSDQLLMTGCPVLYDEPLLSGRPFSNNARRVAITVTERHDFWARETALIDAAVREFPHAERYLVVHQNYSPPRPLERFRHRWLAPGKEPVDIYERLRWYAVRRGFHIVCPRDANDCRAFYETIDMHAGSRLHAHLLCLSRAKRSALVPVDGRATGIAAHFRFPLVEPTAIGEGLAADFEDMRARASDTFTLMQRFVRGLPR